jgi:hypothetical protein
LNLYIANDATYYWWQLERHLASGGADRPSEALLAFFYRFRKFVNGKKNKRVKYPLETFLSRSMTLQCNGGDADLDPIFKLIHCCDLFHHCWTRLMQMMESGSEQSLLGKLIRCEQLRSERERNRAKASKLGHYKNSSLKSKWPTRTQEKWSTHRTDEKWPIVTRAAGKKRALEETKVEGDADASQLMAGYGMKRGPRGGLIPRNRPDVAAARSQSWIPEAVGRATKNRKNKKKQTRDEGLKAIALDHLTLIPQKQQQRRPNGKKAKTMPDAEAKKKKKRVRKEKRREKRKLLKQKSKSEKDK